MTIFRLARVRGVAVAKGLASVEVARLVRCGADAYLDIPAEAATAAMRDLAFAGIAAEPSDADLDPPEDLAVGIGLDLAPLADLAGFDVLRLERVPLGAATAEVLRRRVGGLLPPGRGAQERCRNLLRGECVMFRWGRRVWARRGALRAGKARSSIRPVVFDPAALDQWKVEGRTCTHDEALARWVFP